MLAGKFGDAWNLGFLAETEKQVEAHIENHKARLPREDRRSWEILEQMRIDEKSHASTAQRLGARELPALIKGAMLLSSKVMTKVSYYL